MSNGSEAGSGAYFVPLPGHTMPVGADAQTEKGFRDWVASVHPVFEEMKLADLLIEVGYDRVAVVGAIDEDTLRESFGVKRGHATLFVLAARALRKSLGLPTPSEVASVVTTSHMAHATKRRAHAPKVPLAGSSSGCGVAGLGTVASVRAWMLQLISWARSNWGEAAAMAVADINRDSAAQVFPGQVDEEFDIALHEALITDLPEGTIRFLGTAAEGSSGLQVLQLLVHPVLGAKGHSSTQQALQQFETYPGCTSRATLLEWLMGFEQLCTLLAQVGEPVSQARKEVKIEQCIKDIAGVSAEIKAARAGAAGAKQDFEFVKMVTTMAMDGAQERTKKVVRPKAHSAKQQQQQKKKKKQPKATDDDEAEQGRVPDDEEDWDAWATSAEGQGWIADKARKQQTRGGKGGKGGRAKGNNPHMYDDVPRMICRSYWTTGACPRRKEHGFCPYSHYTEEQIIMGEEGYWRPKPGFMEAGSSGGGPPRQRTPLASMGSATDQQEWDWETGSQSSARSAGSSKSAVHHALSVLAGVLALTNPVQPSRSLLHGAFGTLPNGPSRSTTGAHPGDGDPCQTASVAMRSEAAVGQASEGNKADSKGQIGCTHPNHPTTLRHIHEVYTGGGTQSSQSVILDIGATHDIIGSRQATLADRVRTLTEPIQLFTAGGVRKVRKVGDLTLKGALGFAQAMIAPWSSLSLVSLPTRLSEGWTWSAAGREACLVSPSGEPHRFSLQGGLFRYTPDSITTQVKPVKRVAYLNASDDPVAEPKSMPEGPKVVKQGVKQGKGVKGLLNSKTLALLLTLMLTAWACGTPTTDPQLQLITNELRESIRHESRPHSVRKASVTPSPIPHGVRGHIPHDPDCIACKQSRLTATPATRNALDSVIEDSDKGFVLGIDLYGPFTPDVDGNVYALVGVEVGHTNYGMVRLLPDKTAAECATAVASMRTELRTMSKDPRKDLVRLHSDDDKSFKGELKAWLASEGIRQTDTGGYRPTNNSRVERRIRMINEAFRASLLVATGGLPIYESLWGPGLVQAMHSSNCNVWVDGRCPYLAITGKEYKWEKRDMCFGQSGLLFIEPEHRQSKFQPTGRTGIWVGRSRDTPDAVRVVPTTWDPTLNAFTLGQVVEMVGFTPSTPTSFLLKEGPHKDRGSKTVREFVSKYNLPTYKGSGRGFEHEQVEGRDPVLEVEAIQGKIGRANKTRYLVKWKGHIERTLEPKSHLKGCMDLVQQYEDSLNKARSSSKAKRVTASGMSLTVANEDDEGVMSMMSPDPGVYIIDVNNEFVLPRHHRFTEDERGSSMSQPESLSYLESEAICQLLRQQKRAGTVEEWAPGYRAELSEVTRRRLRPLTNDEVMKVGAASKAVRLRMNLEPKRDGRRKCRLILQGFREPKSWDRGTIDSPVASLSTIRAMVFLMGRPGDILSSIDVSTAFLQSESYDPNDAPRYVSYQPCKSVPIQYFQLLGPLYGQRSASMRWYHTVKKWLISEGFKSGLNEPCVFTHPNGLRIAVWVDDIIVRGSPAATEDFYTKLGKRFDIKDPSYLTPQSPLCFVGLDIEEQHTSEGPVRVMHQNSVMAEYLNSLDIQPNPIVMCPMPESAALWSDSEPLNEIDASWYRSQIGSLNYFAMTTRYDIAHSVSRLSQCAANPTRASYTALVRVIKYLKNTPNHSLKGKVVTKDTLEIYSDSDHAGDKPHTTKSHTGCMIILNGAPIQWISKKQIESTAYSSAMAEIYALSETVRVARSVAWRLEELNMLVQYPLVVKVDNKQSKTFQEGTCINSRLRGVVDMREAWVQELRDLAHVMVQWVPQHTNKADLLTKCFPNWIYQARKKLITG